MGGKKWGVSFGGCDGWRRKGGREGWREGEGKTNGDEIPPADPAAEGLVEGTPSDPVAPAAFHDAFFEEGAREEEAGEEEGAEDVERADGIPA